MEKETEKNINVTINDGDAFFAHEISVNFNPLQFVFDFKSITPRIDMRAPQGHSISLKHNVVLLDPFHVKQFYEMLGGILEKYETEFGKIDKTKPLQAFEKKMQAENKEKKGKNSKETTNTASIPSYLG